jgi:glutamate synthase domain-containing protein 1
MQRRHLLKTVAMGMTGIISMPTWANNWNQNNFHNLNFSEADNNLLAEIAETIIPETDTPGAKSLGVHKLIQKIVTDCQGKEAETKLSSDLAKLQTISKNQHQASFEQLSADKKLAIFKSLESNTDMKDFYAKMKRMTIDGYMKSEYVMTNITKYEYAPARWNGCVTI